MTGGSHEFLNVGERMLNGRTVSHYYATGPMPAMAASKPGSGAVYAARDWQGLYFDGGTTYTVTLPDPVPVGQYWSFMVYDNQTRSIRETDWKRGGIDSHQPTLKRMRTAR